MIIREFRNEDLAEVLEICNYYIETSTATFELSPLTINEMSSRFDGIRSRFPILVAEDDNGLVAGYAYVHPWKERPAYWPTLELTVYLRTDATGNGLGRLLVGQLIERTRTLNHYSSIIACITADNFRSINLFHSLGFKDVSYFKQVGMKFGQMLDVVDLQLIL